MQRSFGRPPRRVSISVPSNFPTVRCASKSSSIETMAPPNEPEFAYDEPVVSVHWLNANLGEPDLKVRPPEWKENFLAFIEEPLMSCIYCVLSLAELCDSLSMLISFSVSVWYLNKFVIITVKADTRTWKLKRTIQWIVLKSLRNLSRLVWLQ